MRKKIFAYFIVIAGSALLFSCIKNDHPVFEDNVVEFDAATWNANNAHTVAPDSIPFPILTRRPAAGRASNTSDPTVTRTSGTVTLRVNMLGIPRKSATEVNYRVLDSTEYKLIGVAINPNYKAIAGTHYNALPGKLTIPADSSWGYVNIEILNPGTSSSVQRELVLMLTESAGVNISRNYKVVGIRISQL